MHAVVITVDFKPGREAEQDQGLDFVVAATKELAGFVSGTWVGNATHGLCLLKFTDEASARSAADSVNPPPEAPVALRSVDVYVVAREA